MDPRDPEVDESVETGECEAVPGFLDGVPFAAVLWGQLTELRFEDSSVLGIAECSGIADVAEVFLAFGFERGVETGGGCFCHDSG